MKEAVLEKEFLILVILSEKMSHSVWQDFADSHEKKVQFMEEWNNDRRTWHSSFES